ncbi:MAG: hypothetical protein WCG67_09395 [Ferruginibacter sp.]
MTTHIVDFISNQTCANICCIDENYKPYCFSCFYVLNSDKGVLYFKSSIKTKHVDLFQKQPNIAGTILPDKLNKLFVKGIQFEGRILDSDHPLTIIAPIAYYKNNPAAIAIPGQLWVIEIDHIKMTDSTLGFGKKITWNRKEITVAI